MIGPVAWRCLLGMAALDTQVAVETPEGVLLRLTPAGPVVRALAYAVDLLAFLVIYAVAGTVLGALGGFGVGALMVVGFVLQWLYPLLFEVFNDGQTPGKRCLDIRTVHDDGTPVRLRAAAIRALLMPVDGALFSYLPALISMLCARRFRRLGDLAAGTLVVHAGQVSPGGWPPRTHLPALAPTSHVAGPPVVLQRHEQQLIVDFAERVATLTAARASELADVLSDLTHRNGGAGVDVLIGYAASITGDRVSPYPVRENVPAPTAASKSATVPSAP